VASQGGPEKPANLRLILDEDDDGFTHCLASEVANR
jgi:hypothetical protein